jgi:hypothetical protein
MNNKASSLKSSIEQFARRQGIDAEIISSWRKVENCFDAQYYQCDL